MAKRSPRIRFVAALVVLALVAACGDKASVEKYVARAQDYLTRGEIPAAVIELKNAIQKDPQNGQARALLGETYVKLAQYEAAEKELVRARQLGIEQARLVEPLSLVWVSLNKSDKVLSEFPLDSGASTDAAAAILVAHGYAYSGLGKRTDAEASFKAALAKRPEYVPALIGLGRLALVARDDPGAQAYLERAVNAAPGKIEVLALRGDIELARSKPAEAEQAYAALFKAIPSNPLYELALARAQLAAGKRDEAVKHLDALLKRSPKHPDVNYLAAVAAYEKKDFEATKNYADAVLALAPEHMPSNLLAGAAAFALKQDDQAIAHLSAYIDHNPNDEQARRMYAASLMRVGNNGQAQAVLQPLAIKNSNDAELLAAIGTAAAMSGDLRTGAKYFEQLAHIRPNDAVVLAQLGTIKVSLGEEEKGLDELERAIAADPGLDAAQLTAIRLYLKRKDYDKAIEAAELLQQRFPQNPMGSTLVGFAATAKGDFEGAKAAFRRALAIQPGAPDASANLAALELREGKSDDALALLREALGKNPDNMNIVLRVAQLEAQTDKSKEAISRLKAFIDNHPDAIEPRVLLAAFYIRDQEPQKALDLVEDKLPLEPNNPALLAVVGQARLAAKRPQQAAEVLRILVGKQPQSADAHRLLAEAYRQLGDQPSYKTQLEKALALEPQQVNTKLQLASLAAQQGDKKTAVKLLGELKQAEPNNPDVIELDGAVAILENQPAKAVELFRKSAQMRPQGATIAKIAAAQERAGDAAGGRSTLSAWLRDHPEDVVVLTFLADMELRNKNDTAAKDLYVALVKVQPDNVMALNNLAWLLANDGNARAAVRPIEHALQLAPNAPAIKDTAGVVYLKLGEPDRALPLLREAAEKLPENQDVQYHYAQALAAQGASEEAKAALTRALTKAGDFEGRSDAQKLLKQLGGS